METRVNGKPRRMTIGRHGHITCEQARKEAQKLLGNIATGSDPVAEKRAARVKGITLRQAYADYLQTLMRRRYESSSSEWVFPSPLGPGPLTEPRTALDRIEELSGIKFTLHDLRRTFITVAESLDIPAYALKQLLNHKNGNDVTAGYIVPDINRLRGPMQRISDYLWSQLGKDSSNHAELYLR